MAQSMLYPIWAQVPDIAENIAARDRFERALRARGLGPSILASIHIPPAPRTPELYQKAISASPFAPPHLTLQAFTAAVDEALANGGAGLRRHELTDLFFRQAVAILAANPSPSASASNQAAIADAKRACLRAAVLGLEQTPLGPDHHSPVRDLADRAIFEVKERPRANLFVHAPVTATVFIDGQIYPAPAQARALSYGEHFIRVEEKGFAPWSVVAIVNEPDFHLDPPQNLLLQFSPSQAASMAQSQGAAFSLLGQLRLGAHHVIDLSLIESGTGVIRASASVPAGGDETPLIAAVLRLDEEANRANLLRRHPENKTLPFNASMPPTKPSVPPLFQQDPLGWGRTHWPLVTAIGTTIGSALILGILVATSNNSSQRP